DCNPCAKLRSPDGGDIATGTRTNYRYIIVCVCHNLTLFVCCFGCCQYSTSRLARTGQGMVQMNLTVPHQQPGPGLSRLRAAKDLAADRDRPFAARRRDKRPFMAYLD